MRQNSNARRSRGRGNRKQGNSRNQVFDSNGPGARVRGNSAQVYEKYQQLARDASSGGDRVAAEGFLQHAEHYYRLMEAAGLNRDNNSSDQNQQQPHQPEQTITQEPAPQKNDSAQSTRSEQGIENSETITEHPPESVAALIEAVEQGSVDRQEEPSSAQSSIIDKGEEPKPVRRSRVKRNGSGANGRRKQQKTADRESTEDDSAEKKEENKPVSA